MASPPDNRSLGKSLFLTCLILFPLGLFLGLKLGASFTDPPLVAPFITVGADPSSEMILTWETPAPAAAKVRFGADPVNPKVLTVASGKIQHLNLTGLSPDTTYFYEVEVAGTIFGRGTFRTAPDSGKAFTWVMFSDTQQSVGSGWHYRVAHRVREILPALQPAFVTLVGDFVSSGSDRAYFYDFFDTAAEYLDAVPMAPVIGNHDRYSPSVFWDYFVNNATPGTFFYSFNWSDVHFTAADFTYGRQGITDAQLVWLQTDLARNQGAAFRVVFFHCPVEGSGLFGLNADLREKVLPLLLEYNVSLVVHGHEHHYERGVLAAEESNDGPQNIAISGIPYMILGGGGGMLDPGVRPLPGTQVLVTSPNYTTVNATSTALRIVTRGVDNTVLDAFTLTTTGGILP